MSIIYLKGDATDPQAGGHKVITHICNDIGGWGKGFVLAVSKKWKGPEAAYRKWYKSGTDFKQGNIQLIPVTEDISVANMIGQKGIYPEDGVPPIRYESVESCLEKLAAALDKETSIHMPRIGCGLAGGKWELIEPIIEKTLVNKGFAVYVYDYD